MARNSGDVDSRRKGRTASVAAASREKDNPARAARPAKRPAAGGSVRDEYLGQNKSAYQEETSGRRPARRKEMGVETPPVTHSPDTQRAGPGRGQVREEVSGGETKEVKKTRKAEPMSELECEDCGDTFSSERDYQSHNRSAHRTI